MKTLPVNGHYYAIVDDCDFEFLSRWRWGWKRSTRRHNSKIYVKRTKDVWANGFRLKSSALYLHHVVLERAGKPRPSPDYDGDHINGNSFDNTRGNLRWRHKSKNRPRL